MAFNEIIAKMINGKAIRLKVGDIVYMKFQQKYFTVTQDNIDCDKFYPFLGVDERYATEEERVVINDYKKNNIYENILSKRL